MNKLKSIICNFSDNNKKLINKVFDRCFYGVYIDGIFVVLFAGASSKKYAIIIGTTWLSIRIIHFAMRFLFIKYGIISKEEKQSILNFILTIISYVVVYSYFLYLIIKTIVQLKH